MAGALAQVDGSRRQEPERPPDFSHSATSEITIERSWDLHMS